MPFPVNRTFPAHERKISSFVNFSMLQLLRDIPSMRRYRNHRRMAAFGHKIIEIGIVRIENAEESPAMSS